MEPDVYYLIENTKTGMFYCVHEPGLEVVEGALEHFLGNEFKIIEEIKPKNTDWFQTHWVYVVVKHTVTS